MKRSRFWWSQIIVCLVAFLALVLSSTYAATTVPTQQIKSIQSLEDALFAVHYDQDSVEARLSRLEQTIYGQTQTGSVDTRLAKLQKVLSPNSLGPLSPTAKPVESTPPQQQPVATSKKPTPKATATNTAKPESTANNIPPSQDATDYPTVTQMEQKVFGKVFVQEDITQRLGRLEKQVFKNAQNGSLADRVDNLRLVVLGDVPTSAPNIGYIPQGYPQQNYGYPSPPSFPNSPYSGGGMPNTPGQGYSGQPNYNAPPSMAYPSDMSDPNNSMANGMGAPGDSPTPDMIAAIGEVEKEVIGQQFPSDPFNARLDRLEGKIFHSTSPEMPLEDRMQRIAAVATAGGAPESPRTKTKHTIQALLPIILTILPLVLL